MSGNITLEGGTSDSGVLDITGNVLAGAALTINTTDAGGGNVTITGKLDSTGADRDIDILSGAGLTTITGNIGTVRQLNTLDINAAGGAGGVTISGDIGAGAASGTTMGVAGATNLGNANTTGNITLSGEDISVGGAITAYADEYSIASGTTALTIVTTNDAVLFKKGTSASQTGKVTLGEYNFSIDTDTTDTADGNQNGGNVTFEGDIIGATHGSSNTAVDISLDAGADGTVTVLGVGHTTGGSDNTEINAVTLTGLTVSTNGKINTVSNATNDKGTVTITGALSLAGNTTIETDTAASTTLDGDITIAGTINGANTLTLSSGAGAIDISGTIGGSAPVGTVAINATAGGVGNEATGTIAIADVIQSDNTAGTASTFTVGNTGTTKITFDGDDYVFAGDAIFTAASGNTFDNVGRTAVITDYKTTGTTDITFAGGTLYIQDATTGVKIDTSSGNGEVTLASVDGDHDESFTITAGSGAVAVGRIGGSSQLTATGDGVKTVAITSSTGITLSGDINTADAVTSTITLTGPVVISGDVDIDTNTSGTDGTLEFTSTIRGTDNTANTSSVLELDTGTGAITFSAANTIIGGGSKPLDTLKINISDSDEALTIPQIGTSGGTVAGVLGQVDIGNTTATASISMQDELYNFGTGNVTLNTVATGTTTFAKADNVGVNLGGGDFKIDGKVAITGATDKTLDINSGGGSIEITKDITGTDGDENLILDDNGTGTSGIITLGGNVGADSGVASNIKAVTLVGTGGVKLTGDITTSSTAGGAVSITGPVTLEGDVIIDADAANTTVTFNSTATVNSDSTERDLDIRTAGGKITMDATIGNSAAIGILKINSAGTPTGDIDLVGLAGVATSAAIGNSSTNLITLDGTTYTTAGTQTYTTDTGDKIV